MESKQDDLNGFGKIEDNVATEIANTTGISADAIKVVVIRKVIHINIPIENVNDNVVKRLEEICVYRNFYSTTESMRMGFFAMQEYWEKKNVFEVLNER